MARIIRTIRVPADLWEQARAKAASEHTTVSAVLVAALVRYVKG